MRGPSTAPPFSAEVRCVKSIRVDLFLGYEPDFLETRMRSLRYRIVGGGGRFKGVGGFGSEAA